MQLWTKPEIDFLCDSLHLSTKELYIKFCDEFGSDERTYDSVQKKIKVLREAHAEDEADPEQPDNIDAMLQDQNKPQFFASDANAVKRLQLKEEAKMWLQGILDLSKNITYHPDGIVEGNERSLCVLISDSHVGKHNDEFNLEIAKERFESMPEQIAKIEGTKRIDEVVLMLLGDIVEGEDIFRTQAHHIECSAIDQVKIASDTIWSTILLFQKVFRCPVRVETVPGNHGRMSRTANEKTNWDNVTYHILSTMAAMHGDKNVAVHCNFDWFKLFKVKDKVGMLNHYGVKHTGTPAMREKVAGWSAKKHFDFMCHGHWHEWHIGSWLGKVVISNGCLCGPDDLAERMAREDQARQGYFLVTPGRPIHGFNFIEW